MPVSDPRCTEQRTARDAWCATIALGQNCHTFAPHEIIRCPMTVQRDGQRVVCGTGLGAARPQSRVTVRVRSQLHPPSGLPGKNLTCRQCHAKLEELYEPAEGAA